MMSKRLASQSEAISKLSAFERHLLSKFDGRVMIEHNFFIHKSFRLPGAGVKSIGYLPTKEMIYIGNGLPKFRHEVAHMVEMQDLSRITQMDWGMPVYDMEHCTPSKIVAGIARETRVLAIDGILRADKAIHTSPEQARFQGWVGYAHLTSKEYRYKLSQNADWMNALEDCGHLPFGRFQTTSDIVEWSNGITERTVKAWSKDRIETVWCERVEHILNWMESR